MGSDPPVATGKRKRDSSETEAVQIPNVTTVQIVTGSYERVLHGLTVSIPNDQLVASTASSDKLVNFSDNFLFHAHASSIRCLALSPPSTATPNNSSKRLLATGGTDERINLFSISAAAPQPAKRSRTKFFPELSGHATDNRELGALTHHTSAISTLCFPSRSKLLSTSYDNSIAITRVRDWSLLSTIRAPLPKSASRPSGDTAGPGELPAGINAVAVHPSAKLCLSVGQGERCMRLWNLVTGKKAGVLTFDKSSLALLGEGRWRGGEGRSVVWNEDGDEFAVGFERGALIFGHDCQIRGIARVAGAKVCQLRYVHHRTGSTSYLVLSTEDGRLMFFNPSAKDSASSENRLLKVICQVGSTMQGRRIKDFAILPFENDAILIVTSTSDGVITLWKLDLAELEVSKRDTDGVSLNGVDKDTVIGETDAKVNIVGELLGTYQTSQRITCIAAFIMEPFVGGSSQEKANGTDEAWEGFDSEGAEEEEDDDDSEDSDEE